MQNHRTLRLCLLLTTIMVSLGMSRPSVAQDRNFESCPLEVIAKGWQTKTIDNVANGSLGVMLERFDQTWPTWMLSAVRQAMELGLDKKVLDANTGLTVTIDAKNGYAEVSDDGTDGEYATVCYWNRPGGHKLLAVLLGKPTDPSIELLCFYDYDPQRRTLTPEPDIVQECCQPEHGGEMAFQLPRKGTALTVTEYSGALSYSRIYKWDGRLFTFDRTEKEALQMGTEDETSSKQAQLAHIRKLYAEAKAQAANSKQANETVVTSKYTLPASGATKDVTHYYYHGAYDENTGGTFFTPYLIISRHNVGAKEYYEEMLFDEGVLVFYFSKQGNDETRYYWNAGGLLNEVIKGQRLTDDIFAARMAGDLKEAFDKLMNTAY